MSSAHLINKEFQHPSLPAEEFQEQDQQLEAGLVQRCDNQRTCSKIDNRSSPIHISSWNNNLRHMIYLFHYHRGHQERLIVGDGGSHLTALVPPLHHKFHKPQGQPRLSTSRATTHKRYETWRTWEA